MVIKKLELYSSIAGLARINIILHGYATSVIRAIPFDEQAA